MKKFFTENQMAVAAVVGGPIPPGILFYLNYKRIDKEKESYISIGLTLIFTVALFYTLLRLPEDILDKIPNAVFTSIYGLFVYFAYRRFLSKEINARFDTGDAKASNWTVAAITLLGLAINLIIILGLAWNTPAFDGDKKIFGEVGHEIYFDKSNTTIDDVEKLGQVLTDFGYFNNEYPIVVHLDTWETRYVVTLQIDKQFWEDDEVLAFLNDLKINLEVSFLKDVTIKLEHYDLSGKKYEKAI